MAHRSLRFGLFLIVLFLVTTFCTPAQVRAGTTDQVIPNRHFYTQAAGPRAPANYGYSITDEGTDNRGQSITFWREFQRLGGVPAMGYLAGNRFMWNGFWCHVTQRVILQWRPEVNGIPLVNIFDLLNQAGFDSQLKTSRQVPLHESPNDAGNPFSQAIVERQSWLDTRPAIKAFYLANPNAVLYYGLPTSHIDTSNPNFDIVCLQRIVIQQWKVNVPGVATIGMITVGLGGDIAKGVGIIAAQDANAVIQAALTSTPPSLASSPRGLPCSI